MNKTAFAIAAAIAASAAPAFAEPVEETRSIRVSYADLDLARMEGRATLEARVNRAVRRLCQMPYGGDVRAMVHYRQCRSGAWAGARVQLASIYSKTRYAGYAPLEVAAK